MNAKEEFKDVVFIWVCPSSALAFSVCISVAQGQHVAPQPLGWCSQCPQSRGPEKDSSNQWRHIFLKCVYAQGSEVSYIYIFIHLSRLRRCSWVTREQLQQATEKSMSGS
ncbi:hypothetical protein XENTR_v10024526 [Xenopus tropicalis]|nr:hypothetical protein XENTR_v10024526 [Xenopus tropicalis]